MEGNKQKALSKASNLNTTLNTDHITRSNGNQGVLNIYKKTSRVEILCINIKLYNLTSGRTNHRKVYQNQLKRLKRAEKLIFLKSEPIFSEASQMEWHEPFDFQTGISGFPCQLKEPLDLSSLVLTHGAHACNSICPINIPKHITGTLCVYC